MTGFEKQLKFPNMLIVNFLPKPEATDYQLPEKVFLNNDECHTRFLEGNYSQNSIEFYFL